MLFAQIKAGAIAAIQKVEAAFDSIEHLFGSAGKVAFDHFGHDVASDVEAAVTAAAADPSLVTDAAKRDAAVKTLLDNAGKQGIAEAENAAMAMVAAKMAGG